MPTVPYFYLRLLELEGRHPHDVGAWASSFHRLLVGEGNIPDDHPEANVPYEKGMPFPPVPNVSRILTRKYRMFSYRRIRSALECERYFHNRLTVANPCINIPLTASWANPTDGRIPLPTEAELLTHTHNVIAWRAVAEQRLFVFANTWGADWGHHGDATLPYEYFDRYCFDSWVLYAGPPVLRSYVGKTLGSGGLMRWSARDEEDHRLYGFEARNPADDDRLAWAFAIERDGAIEVEELYVRPEFRGRGHGRWLCERMVELARVKQLPLRVWVPFADAKRESPSTFLSMKSIVRKMGLYFHPCQARWAAYFATNEALGSESPVEPATFPERPKSTLEAVLAAALILGQPATPSSPSIGEPTGTTAVSHTGDFPTPGTPAWADMNKERAALIRKKVRGELTPAERERYVALQGGSLAALERAFPREGIDE